MLKTSKPYIILMYPFTYEIINIVRVLRTSLKLPICFTLDAGANVHLLYPLAYKKDISAFIDQELKVFCQNGQYISDQVGKGAVKF